MTPSDHEATSRRVYDHSVDRYVDAIGTEISERFETRFDQAMIASFIERLQADDPGPVLDVGCGPGRIAALLADRGLDASGCDIASGMVEAARAAHPNITFTCAPLTNLPAETASLAGAVYWYSIIATPPEALDAAWDELGRALRRNGEVLVAFQAGDGEAIAQPNAHGSDTTLTLFRHSPNHVAETLRSAGFAVHSTVTRDAELEHETTAQGFVMARKALRLTSS